MSEEELERAFEPFFTTKGEDEGTGLGLSMAYGYVKQSGGHIEIDSDPSEGTTVRLYLPHTPEAEERIDEDRDAAPAPAEGGDDTVLVVEDDDGVRATAVEMLEDLGYRVLQAADGESALAVLHGAGARPGGGVPAPSGGRSGHLATAPRRTRAAGDGRP